MNSSSSSHRCIDSVHNPIFFSLAFYKFSSLKLFSRSLTKKSFFFSFLRFKFFEQEKFTTKSFPWLTIIIIIKLEANQRNEQHMGKTYSQKSRRDDKKKNFSFQENQIRNYSAEFFCSHTTRCARMTSEACLRLCLFIFNYFSWISPKRDFLLFWRWNFLHEVSEITSGGCARAVNISGWQ